MSNNKTMASSKLPSLNTPLGNPTRQAAPSTAVGGAVNRTRAMPPINTTQTPRTVTAAPRNVSTTRNSHASGVLGDGSKSLIKPEYNKHGGVSERNLVQPKSSLVPQGFKKVQPRAKMSLVCKLKMTSIRREANLIKQTLPLTDDLMDVLCDKAVIRPHIISELKRTDINSRWDPVFDYVQANPQISIFGIWDYLMQKKESLLPERLQSTFNKLVNQHFETDLQPLQLNKDRQNKVAKVMLDNLRKADGYVDELNASIRQYQSYTHKLAGLVKEPDLNASASSSTLSKISASREVISTTDVPESIHVIYDKVKTYLSHLEKTNEDKDEEMERLQIKLYEAQTEIETLENNANKLKIEIREQQKQIKSLKTDREALENQLTQKTQELNEVQSDRHHFNKKLDEMMNTVMKGMSTLKTDLKSEIKQDIAAVAVVVDQKVSSLETNMEARMGDVQDTVNAVLESQDGLRGDLERVVDKMQDIQKQKKEKKVNLNINIHGGDARDQEFKTRSDKLRSVQGK